MKDVFSYELLVVAPGLFLGNDMTCKTNKAELMNALLALSPCIIKTYSADSNHVIDGFSWFCYIPWPKGWTVE